MAIQCPYCGHRMALRDAKPGRYQPKCGKCGERFRLMVPSPPGEPTVQRMTPEEPASAATPAAKTAADVSPLEATLPQPPATLPASSATMPLPPAQAPSEAAATGDWTAAASAARSDVTLDHTATQASAAAPLAAATARPVATRASSEEAGSPADAQAQQHERFPDRLGGYRLLRELGRGAMGAVYLARQLSLDRNVALKTVQTQWTDSPQVMARFTREAYAAAQLTHHNVVQIYDLGADRDIPYFSMEYVKGESLADLLQREKKLPPQTAAGYVLQAARGLQFAHRHGMVHRDVKPANLMLDEHGVVKVADLGLVKTPELLDLDAADAPAAGASPSLAAALENVTLMNSAMGTPAFMAPEQVENAAGVDHRADIYALGCTFYALLTGRPPFDGNTALEVITKQKTLPVPRIEAIDPSVPADLSKIVMRMVAKRPEERYRDLDQVVAELESYLGIGGAAKLPNEEHRRILEAAVDDFNRSPAARLRRRLVAGFVAGAAALALVSLLFGGAVATGFLAMLTAGSAVYFILTGIRDRTYLFDKTREMIFASRWSDWLAWMAGGVLVLLAGLALGWLWVWIPFAVVGAMLALGLHTFVDARVRGQRQPAVDRIEEMLKSLRLRGVDEANLRRFVAEYAGDDWEEFFEALFGYEAKLEARAALPSAQRRRRHRAWREPVVRWLAARVQAQREARDRAHLAKIEQANLRAKGLDAEAARRQAEQLAKALVVHAAETRLAAERHAEKSAAPVDPQAVAAAKRARIKQMLAEARNGQSARRSFVPAFLLAPLALALSGKMRFLLGCLLLAGCVLWIKQNDLFSADDVRAAAADAMQQQNVADVAGDLRADAAQAARQARPLDWPGIGAWFDSFNPGVAGLVLLALAMFRGGKMSLFALPAAAMMVWGPSLGVPGIEAIGGSHTTSLALGLAIAALGLVFGRSTNEG